MGVPSICRAEVGNCPYGGESGNENHFYTYSEAQKRSQEIFEESYRVLPSSASEDPNDIMREIEARRKVKGEIRKDLPQGNEYEITKSLRYTDDEVVIMGVIEGEIYENSGWEYASVVLQNPNIPRDFRDDVLFRHPGEFDITTRRWMVLNKSLTHEDLMSIIDNENEDMTMRAIAFKNSNIDDEYVKDIIDNDIDRLEKLPYSMIVHGQHKNAETENVNLEASILGIRNGADIDEALSMSISFSPWELRYRKDIEEERKT